MHPHLHDPQPQTGPVTETPAIPRERGTYTTVGGTSVTSWVSDPDGPLIRSIQPDGRHAPIFDIDRPISVTQVTPGTWRLSFGPVDNAALRHTLRTLAHHGFVEHSVARHAIAAMPGNGGTVFGVIDLCVPARAVPSHSDGHDHMYVEQLMTLHHSMTFARALGIVDRNQVSACHRSGEWLVRSEPPVPAPVVASRRHLDVPPMPRRYHTHSDPD